MDAEPEPAHDRRLVRRIELAGLAAVIVLALVMFFLRLGPAPLVLLPWLVAAGLTAHLVSAEVGAGDDAGDDVGAGPSSSPAGDEGHGHQTEPDAGPL